MTAQINQIPVDLQQLAEKEVTQKFLTDLHSEVAQASLLNKLPQSGRARLRSLGARGAQAWMLAHEGNAPRMDDLTVLISCRRSLGAPLPNACSGERRCLVCPGAPFLDKEGYHFSVCKAAGEATRLHNSMNWQVLQMFRDAGRYASTDGKLFGDKPVSDGHIYGGGPLILVCARWRKLPSWLMQPPPL